MKKILLFSILITVFSLIHTEDELKHIRVVGKPRRLMNEFVGNVYDVMNEHCGLIKINSDMKEMSGFAYNSHLGIVKVNKNPGEHEIYLSPSEQVLYVYAEGYEKLTLVFSDYGIQMRSNTVWEVKITGSEKIIEEELFNISFDLGQNNVFVSYNFNAPILQKTDNVIYKIPKGKYEFRFEKDGFKSKKLELNVESDILKKIELEKDIETKNIHNTGILYINTEPEDADILVDGQLSNYQTELVEGFHTVEIRKPLFLTQKTEIEIKSGEVIQRTFKLKPNFGWIEVNSGLKDCAVLLDTKLIGMTDSSGYFKSGKIYAKKYIVKIEKDIFYESFEKRIEIVNNEVYKLNANLEEKFGKLYVDSKPVDGAKVFIDDSEKGTTPYKNEKIIEGTYRISVGKEPLYKYEDRVITITRGKEIHETIDFNQGLNFANIEIETEPETAEIFVDGNPMGTGSVRTQLIKGEHLIELKHDKYINKEERINIVPGIERKLKYKLIPKTAKLTVFVEPKEASESMIYLNNKESGKSPKIFPNLLIGKYMVRIENEDFLPETKEVLLAEGMSKELQFNLRKSFKEFKQKEKFWKRNKYISLGTFLLSAGASVYFYMDYDSNYSSYKTADLPLNAKKYWDNAESSKKYFTISASASAAPLIWFLYSWIKESSYDSRK